jgi:hypothetical protein
MLAKSAYGFPLMWPARPANGYRNITQRLSRDSGNSLSRDSGDSSRNGTISRWRRITFAGDPAPASKHLRPWMHLLKELSLVEINFMRIANCLTGMRTEGCKPKIWVI